jgi:hypothetical protein
MFQKWPLVGFTWVGRLGLAQQVGAGTMERGDWKGPKGKAGGESWSRAEREMRGKGQRPGRQSMDVSEEAGGRERGVKQVLQDQYYGHSPPQCSLVLTASAWGQPFQPR